MTTALAAVGFLVYLAGIGALTVAWPHAIRQHPTAQHLTDTNPVGVCLWLALITVAWPGTVAYALIAHLAQRSPR